MSSRLRNGDPTCQMCGHETETEIHLAATCPFTRSYWYASDLALRTEGLGDSIKGCLIGLVDLLTEEQWTSLVASLWGVWRSRNDCVFKGRLPSVNAVLQYRSSILMENHIAASVNLQPHLIQREDVTLAMPPSTGLVCFVDGSWAYDWIGGAGYLLVSHQLLVAYRFERITVSGAFQAEACALLNAMQYAIEGGFLEVCFLTDCKVLAEAGTGLQPPVEVEWRAQKEVFEIWKTLKCHRGFSLYHIGRGHNEMADSLARKGRQIGGSYTGFTYPILPIEEK